MAETFVITPEDQKKMKQAEAEKARAEAELVDPARDIAMAVPVAAPTFGGTSPIEKAKEDERGQILFDPTGAGTLAPSPTTGLPPGADIAALDALVKSLQRPGAPRPDLPQLAPITMDPTLRFEEGQAKLVEALQAQAEGRGVSPAALMLERAQDENTRRAMALAASMSGRALPAAQRQILQQQALGAQEAARETAVLKAQEQLAAQQALGAAISAAQAADVSKKELGLQAQKATQDSAIKLARLEQAKADAQSAEELSKLQAQIDVEKAKLAAATAQAGFGTQLEIANLGIPPTPTSMADILADSSKLLKNISPQQVASTAITLGNN